MKKWSRNAEIYFTSKLEERSLVLKLDIKTAEKGGGWVNSVWEMWDGEFVDVGTQP